MHAAMRLYSLQIPLFRGPMLFSQSQKETRIWIWAHSLFEQSGACGKTPTYLNFRVGDVCIGG